MLGSLQIPVAAADVGGKAGRKIVFNSGTGEVLVRRQAAGGLAGSEGMLPKK
jgi:chemotaxis receptor (MCP) glutamine deamidase CheD